MQKFPIITFDDHRDAYRVKEAKKFLLKNVKFIPDIASCYLMKTSDNDTGAFTMPPHKL